MSTNISAKELSWNSGTDFTTIAADTLSDTVEVTLSGGDGQYLFVFQNENTASVSVEAQTGSGFWMEDQGTISDILPKSADSSSVPVVLGPLEGGRFKNTDGTIVFKCAQTAAVITGFEANSYLNVLKVPKG